MFDAPFKFEQVNFSLKGNGSSSGNVWLFTFEGKAKESYILEAEEFESNFVMIGFYLKRDENKGNKEKYGLKTNLFESSRVLATCLQIMKFLHLKNPQISFGFIGNPSVDDEKDIGFSNTKRFRIYSQLMANVIAPTSFQHYADPERSMYLLISRNQSENKLEKLTKFLLSRWNSLD